jgi:TPR repeat protein
MGKLGKFYETGTGVPLNYVEAARLYHIAVGKGDLGAMERLGYLYRDGRGVPRNPFEARRLIGMVVSAGNPHLMPVLNAIV